MEMMKQDGIVAMIMEGKEPTLAELSELAPMIKIAEGILSKCKDHIKARLEAGEKIDGCRLKKGAERRTIANPTLAFKTLKAELGESFDPAEWAKVLKVSAADAEKFLVACGTPKKESKAKLAEMLGDAMTVSQNKPSLEIK